jgi:hypothetical protein
VIGNGAQHSEGVFRLVGYNALNGNEGVLGTNDLRVTALGTPGAAVNVGVGACSMLGRGASQVAEMYAARMLTTDTVAIAATGAGAGRSDLVIGRIEDPNISGSGWGAPGVLATGPYVFTRVISGVPNTTTDVTQLNLGYTAVTLARIDLPVNTAAITQSMIVDLRKIANPRRDSRLYTANPGLVYNLTSASFVNWFGQWAIPVPVWATRAVLVVTVGGARIDRVSASVNGNAFGQIRAVLGSAVTQGAGYDLDAVAQTSVSRWTLNAGDTVAIPSSMRGTTQTLAIQGLKSGGTKNLYADTSTFASVSVEFQESAT